MDSTQIPRRKRGVVTEGAGDEMFAFNPKDDMMHALNATAASILEKCDGERSIETIAADLAGEGVDLDMVSLGVAELAEVGLVELASTNDPPTRRDLLMKLGLGAAAVAAIPVVESIRAPSIAAASSGPRPTPRPTPTPTPTPVPCSSEWDKSSYFEEGVNCDTHVATVCNGEDSGHGTCPIQWKLWFIEDGNPKDGSVVGSGTVGPLAAGACTQISFGSLLGPAGNYKLQALQHPGHAGTGVIWWDTCSYKAPT